MPFDLGASAGNVAQGDVGAMPGRRRGRLQPIGSCCTRRLNVGTPPSGPSHRLVLPLDVKAAAGLGRLFSTIGTGDFLHALWESFRVALDFDAGGGMTLFTDQPPHKGFFVYSEALRGHLNEDGYFQGPYALDPVYRHFIDGCPSDLYRLADLAPDDFQVSDYYRAFYQRNQVVDSLELIWRIDQRSASLLYFEREAGSPLFSAPEILAARHWLPVAFAALERHHALAVPDRGSEVDQLLHAKVQVTLDHFGASILTPREREVLGYMLNGYSVMRTAEKLSMAEGTVKIHRNSIHRKLEINSQSELFSLFIRCIPFSRPDHPEDPLLRYHAPRLPR